MADTPDKQARNLRTKIEEAKMERLKNSGNGLFAPMPSQRAKVLEDEAVYNKLQNLREEEAEALERRAKTAHKKGGKLSSASSRADGIAQKGKTRGTIVMCGGGYMKGKK